MILVTIPHVHERVHVCVNVCIYTLYSTPRIITSAPQKNARTNQYILSPLLSPPTLLPPTTQRIYTPQTSRPQMAPVCSPLPLLSLSLSLTLALYEMRHRDR